MADRDRVQMQMAQIMSDVIGEPFAYNNQLVTALYDLATAGLSTALDEACGTVYLIAKALGAIEYGDSLSQSIQADDETLVETVKSLRAEQHDYVALREAAEAVLDEANAQDVQTPALDKLCQALGLDYEEDDDV